MVVRSILGELSGLRESVAAMRDTLFSVVLDVKAVDRKLSVALDLLASPGATAIADRLERIEARLEALAPPGAP